jgi:hypothetical protein
VRGEPGRSLDGVGCLGEQVEIATARGIVQSGAE